MFLKDFQVFYEVVKGFEDFMEFLRNYGTYEKSLKFLRIPRNFRTFKSIGLWNCS